ncbi:TPA: hypothetical protein QHC28_004919 [Aeromonas veronii bv. veronii]|nr:hypothetical protein [Aeromonas veronii bv. veronii]
MTHEVDPDMQSAIDSLTGLTTQQHIDFIVDKMPSNTIKCVMCGNYDVRFVGSDEQLFLFGLPPVLTDRANDQRKYIVSVAECFNCGYMHLFSPFHALRQEPEEEV